jgi:hypothetical protein
VYYNSSGQELECEGKDRLDMNLAGNQPQLIRDAVDAGNLFLKILKY